MMANISPEGIRRKQEALRSINFLCSLPSRLYTYSIRFVIIVFGERSDQAPPHMAFVIAQSSPAVIYSWLPYSCRLAYNGLRALVL